MHITNEQKILAYLYSVPDIQRRQLVIAFPDMPYQSLTRAVRNARDEGYIEMIRRNRSNYLRLSPAGVKYVRQNILNELDTKKRASSKKNTDKERLRRIERVETAINLCAAAQIQKASNVGISLTDLAGPASERQKRFFEEFFYDKGLLFMSDDIVKAIQSLNTVGEEVFGFKSRLIGVIINANGIFCLYNTLDKLMRWDNHSERLLINGILTYCDGEYIQSHPQVQTVFKAPVNAIILGKSCALLPKIWTGDKWGKQLPRGPHYDVRNRLMTYDNLSRLFARIYFVPCNTLGVELLSRSLLLSRQELYRMIQEWLNTYGEYTLVGSAEYPEAYEKTSEDKTLVLPVLEMREIVRHRTGHGKFHVVCERSTQEGLSRTFGEKAIDFRDFDYKPLPFHAYNDNGERADGYNPFRKKRGKAKDGAAE